MQFNTTKPAENPAGVLYKRCTVNLKTGQLEFADIPCRNLEDVLGGFGRSFQNLAQRKISNAYSDENPLIVNIGLLSGTNTMTGMRTYFSSYSPLKASDTGLPSAMWATGSGKFGAKLRWAGLDELIFENRSEKPIYVVIKNSAEGPVVEFKPADDLLGLTTHEKIMALQERYEEAHFAAIGPGGEQWQNSYMGAVALSTENQLKEKVDKSRFAGRGGMGSIMGYKNVLALVVQAPDKLSKPSAEVKKVNLSIIKNGYSARLQPLSQGGGGGTWGAYDGLQPFYAVPENNFRPKGNDGVEALNRENVEQQLEVKVQACFRCGIRCHNNIHERNLDGSTGKFLSKFDYEPLNLCGSNMGLHDPRQAASLIHICDNYGIDAISAAVTIAYVLDYNERNPDKPLLNGATFGEYEKIHDLLLKTGKGELPDIGQGVKRLANRTGQTDYAIHVKGLELPAYLPATNPGYAWAIAGGHMSMATYGLLPREGKSDLESWVAGITESKLQVVGFDMIGLCKFFDMVSGLGSERMVACLKSECGMEVTEADLSAAVRRAFLLGMALEFRQGYSKAEFTLPAETFNRPNPNIKLPNLGTPEFFAELSERVWKVFDPELEKILQTIV